MLTACFSVMIQLLLWLIRIAMKLRLSIPLVYLVLMLPVDTDRCAILRRANFLLDGFNGIQIFAGIQEHFAGPLRKNSITIVTRERGKEKQNKKSRKLRLPGTFGGDDQI